MSETLRGAVESSSASYESLRDELPGVPAGTRTLWQAADRGVQSLQSTYKTLQEDGDLTAEARGRKAGEVFERLGPSIVSHYSRVKQELESAAELNERQSIPRPAGMSLEPSSNEELLTAQNEASRIIRSIERRSKAGGPLAASATDQLRSEYQRGLKAGGIVGAAICRGALEASRELGISEQEWLNELRNDVQRDKLDRARRLRIAASSVPSRAPGPPSSLNKRGPTSSGKPMFQPRTAQLIGPNQ